MNLREGRIGRQETICALAISMIVSGLFTIDSQDAYTNGNSTYISIPIALIIASLVFLLAAWAIAASGSKDIIQMLRFGVGNVLGGVIALIFVLILIALAMTPITRFFDMLHNLFYSTSNYFLLSVYVLPVVILFAWLGLETIGRASKIFFCMIILVHIVILLLGNGVYQPLNLTPIMGDGVYHMTEYALTSNIFFLPALLCVLALTRGTQGLKNARLSGLIAVGAAIIVCGLTQLLIGMVYPYSELAQVYTPLFNINAISPTENALTRLDSWCIFIWLLGGIIMAAFYIYSASYVYTSTFKQRDIRPTVCAIATLVLACAIASHISEFTLFKALVAIREYGIYALTIPVAAASLSALIRAKIEAGSSKRGEISQ